MLTRENKRKVLAQMREHGKSFCDEDYFDGEYVSYSYDQEKATYSIHRSDTIAASYSLDSPLTEEEILSVLDGYSLENLKEQGFDLDDR